MSGAGETPAAPGAWPMYRAMVGVGLLCGLLIVTVYQVTLPAIEQNKAEALQRAIFRVVPGATTSDTYILVDGERFEPGVAGEDSRGREVYVGRDESGQVVGFAIPAAGMGYADVIGVLYGYSAAAEAVVGLQVLESKETPGLGDRIETDPSFVANFERLDASLTDDGAGIAHGIVAVKNGEKENPWEIDGITGATISTKAIADLLNRSTARWVPLIQGRLEQFQTVTEAS